MVRLQPSQEQIIADLKSAKQEYDSQTAAFETWVATQREDRKRRIRTLVERATQEMVPARRMYMALGFDQPGPFLTFLKQPVQAAVGFTATPWEQTAPQAAPAGNFEVVITQDEYDDLTVVQDTHGNAVNGIITLMQDREHIRLSDYFITKDQEHDDIPEIRQAAEKFISDKYGSDIAILWS